MAIFSQATLPKLIELLQQQDVNNLTIDSRQIDVGDAFIAIKGSQANGLDFVDKAIANGAKAIIVDSEDFSELQQIVAKDDTRCIGVESLITCLPELAKQFYQSENTPKVIGVTGTNGKTTVAHGIAQALNALGKTAWISGTLGFGPLDGLQTSANTTMDIVSNWRLFSEAAQHNVDYVVMEVSSHAIAQQRIDSIDFETAIFTNLSRDHLDFHGSLENYANTKLQFLQRATNQRIIINAIDEHGASYCSAIDAKKAFVLADGNKFDNEELNLKQVWNVANIQCQPDGVAVELEIAQNSELVERTHIVSPLLGDFNGLNLAQMYLTLVAIGFEHSEAKQAVEKVQPILGRMQRIKVDGKPLVVVDYAHTPDALEKALIALEKHQPQTLVCVFGCGGDRDKGKRSLMGQAAANHADKVIVTSDNPRTEQPQAIIDDILQADGLGPNNCVTIVDRKQAIAHALSNAAANDIVLIAGKGHETYQEINNQRSYFSDIDTAQEVLEAVA